MNRVVAISAGGVAESIAQLSMPVRWVVGVGSMGVAYRDLAEMEHGRYNAERLLRGWRSGSRDHG